MIPALNEAENIGRCVASAAALQPGWGGPVEVLVVDGGSEDATTALAASAGARVLASPAGRGRQLRCGTEAATGDIVLMLHADTSLDAAAGQQLAIALDDPKVGCGAYRQSIEGGETRFRLLEWGNALRARRFGMPYGDQAIFVRRELLTRVGGVPGVPLMEDVALMQRLRREAWPVLLPGPLRVSARRWRKHGVVGQTLTNWCLVLAYTLGISPTRLAKWYRPNRPKRQAALLQQRLDRRAAELVEHGG
ncbi:MAG: TIGR04283 family arsenosugar biosynthesis glycosyltransferase [Planctomycetota bacterium]